MITVRIVGDVAMPGAALEAARQAALLSLKSDGTTTVGEVSAARNNYIAAQRWAKANPSEPPAPSPWARAQAAAAGSLSKHLASPDDIDLMLSLRHG